MRERSAVALQRMETALVAQLCPHSRASEAASLPASCKACWLCCTLSPGFNHHRKSSEPLTPAPVHSTHGQRRTELLTSLNPSPFINKKTNGTYGTSCHWLLSYGVNCSVEAGKALLQNVCLVPLGSLQTRSLPPNPKIHNLQLRFLAF